MGRAIVDLTFALGDRRDPPGWRGHLRSYQQLAFNQNVPGGVIRIGAAISRRA